MMMRVEVFSALNRILLGVVLIFPVTALAAGNGWFGFGLRTGIDWTLDIESATVSVITQGSPAERAGISVGDSLLEIEGCGIPGCGAYKAKGLLEKKVGEILRLKLKRQDGQEYSASLAAEAEPIVPTK